MVAVKDAINEGVEPPSLLLIVSAPSGAGKTTICRRLLEQEENLKFSVSCTTRKPRPGERDGRDYYFISPDDFRCRIQNGEFVEYAENHRHLYGTSKKTISDFAERGVDILFDIDTRGARALKEEYPRSVSIVVLPPSVDELKKRLETRGTETREAMEIRLKRALDELSHIRDNRWYDYVVVNNDIHASVSVIRAIYLAERHRRERMSGIIAGMLPPDGDVFPDID
ncbi:MAG: guanylate kinase [Deltaproteobacteria bacterium]|nr:guanylate kinase [Deltaproteobacteria bacterium]